MGTIRKRGGRYYAEVSVDGQRKGKTHRTKREAQRWVNDIEAGLVSITPDKVRLADIVDRYKREVSVRHKGRKQECLRLDAWVRELPDKPVSKLTANDFSIWKQAKLEKLKPGTVRRYMTLLNSVFSHALTEWQAIEFNPMSGVKKPPDAPPRRSYPTDDDIRLILEQLDYFDGCDINTKQRQIAVTLLIALETAMRAGEILSLNRRNIDYKKRVVTLVDTKNKDTREVPLSTRAVELLRSVDPEYFTVTSAVHSQLFRRAVIAAGIEDIRFHDSRAAGLMRLSKKLDILDLARMTGHRDPRSLMIYYRVEASEIAKLLD